MDNSTEYFKKISETVHERRMKGELSHNEMEIFREGKKEAFREVLQLMGTKYTFASLTKKCENMLKFLRLQKHGGKLATDESDISIWENDIIWVPEELFGFIELNIQDYRMRLKKAREIHKLQGEMLAMASQLSINDCNKGE